MVSTYQTNIPGVIVIEPKVFGDERGKFSEVWKDTVYTDIGIKEPFRQDNVSTSIKGTLRGLHLQNPNPQGKLVTVLVGEVFDVVVDTRLGSPTFGEIFTIELTSENNRQLYCPPGTAHGFCVIREEATFFYKCTDIYNPESEFSIAWNDPDLNIPWPLTDITLSHKDQNAKPFKELLDRFPKYQEP